MVKIVVDCLGGDNSPAANVAGCVDALNANGDIALVLTGGKEEIEKLLEGKEYDKSRLEIVDAPDTVTGEDRPTDVIRSAKNSSMVRAINMLREDDSVQAMVSLGATGVLLTGAVLRIGRLPGVERPAFCPVMPTLDGGVVGVCDSGANVECTPDRLLQFALMGSLYMQRVCGVKNPRVALLNVGVEEGKGDDLHKEAYKLLKECKALNFAGNMESRDVLSGNYDLIVCDGFSGNVLVKTTEGTCIELLKMLKRELTSSFKAKMGALLLKGTLKKNFKKLNYQNYGGSVMLGTKKVVIKGHGSSKAIGVAKCIEQAYTAVKNDLNPEIEAIINSNSNTKGDMQNV